MLTRASNYGKRSEETKIQTFKRMLRFKGIISHLTKLFEYKSDTVG